MMYVSMLGEMNGTYARGNSFPIVFDTEGCSPEEVSVRVHNGEIRVGKGTDGEEIFGLIGAADEVPTGKYKAFPLTNGELAETEENPLLVVCTNALRFYANTPCLLRVLFCNPEFMLVELVQGSCEFAFADGTFTALQRCDESDLNTKKVAATLDVSGMMDKLYCKTEGGWDMKFEMVNVMGIIYESNCHNARYPSFRKNAYIFNQAAIDAQLKREEEAKAEKARMEDLRREIAEQHLEEARLRHIEDENRAAREKAKKASELRASKGTKKAEKEEASRSVSASDFLSAVANAS